MSDVHSIARLPKILVADDDPAIVDSLSLMLEYAGYNVESTVDGATVRDVHEHLPDLILLDIWMSGQDGRDICKHLKDQDNTKHIPVIMISANRDAQRIALEVGADDFLAKPFDMQDLLAKVAKHTSSRPSMVESTP